MARDRFARHSMPGARAGGFLAPFAAAALLAATGCSSYTESGGWGSNDTYVYVSRAWTPKTVTLIDTRTGESIWSVDVPVGQQAVVRFLPDRTDDPAFPDLITWGILPEGRNSGAFLNQMPCPPSNARLLDFSLRPAPEMPEASVARAEPAPMQNTPPPAPSAEEGPELLEDAEWSEGGR